MKAIYDASDNSLQEQSEMEKPNPDDRPRGDNAVWDSDEWRKLWTEYNAHIASLRKLPCSPEAGFKDGQVYVEGRDYEVRMICNKYHGLCEMFFECEKCIATAVPISLSPDPFPELLSRIATLFSEGKGNEEIAGVLREEWVISKKYKTINIIS